MCGIFGELAPEPNVARRSAWLAAAGERVRSRGPDGHGMWSADSCALGHTRLAIIDLDPRASQPMTSSSGDSIMVFNGEIYNYIELRDSIPDCQWRSSSDSEVLLELLEQRGEGALTGLIGMFAVALFNQRSRDLWLIRDRLGKKPLYYTTTPRGEFRFASDVSALLADEDTPRVTTLDRIAEFLQHGYVAEPRTGFDGIHTVPPGHWLRASLSGGVVRTRVQRYWELPCEVGQCRWASEEAWLEEFRATLEDAVRLRLRSDVPLGAFLSGGVDSSVTSMLATRHLAKLSTFTIDFADRRYSEGAFAAEVANRIGTEHTSVTLVPDRDISIDDVAEVYSDLHGDASAVPTMALCRETRKHVTVALSGDGGDELLGGYTRYLHALRTTASLRRVPKLPLGLARWLSRRAVPFWLRGSNRMSALTSDLGEFYARHMRLYSGVAWPPIVRRAGEGVDAIGRAMEHHHHREPLQRMMATDVDTYLPGDILVKVDRASMAHGLEVRAPLLDHRLFELTANADPGWLSTLTEAKRPLRRLYESTLPTRVFHRPKMGFGPPLAAWLDGGRVRELDRQLASPRSPLAGALSAAHLRALFRAHEFGLDNQVGRLWTLYILHRWAERWRPMVREG